MRAAVESLFPIVALGLALVIAPAGCTGSDSDSRAHQLDNRRTQLDLSNADAFAGDAWPDGDVKDGPRSDAGRTDAWAPDADGREDTGAGASDSWGGFDDAGGADGAGDEDAAGGADTEMPVPEDTWTASDTWTADDTSGGGGDDTSGGSGDDDTIQTASDTTQAATDTSAPPADTNVAEDTSSGGGQIVPPGMKVEWCRLIYPAVVQYPQGGSTDVFAHVSVPGQTDITEVLPDPAPWLRAQIGWGPVAAIPSHDPSAFTWVEADPDPDPPSNLFWRYDRYVTQLAIDSPGSWDYVARFSADAGASWTYCDLDGSQNGYMVGEAGRATVAE